MAGIQREPKEKEAVGETMDQDPKEPSLEERLGRMNLQGEEEEGLDFSKEFEELVNVRWLALFSVTWLCSVPCG